MQTLITGNSNFALELTRLILENKDNTVTLVIKKKDDAILATEKLGINVVNVDPTNTKALDNLELGKYDVVIAAAELEKDNILLGIYAKHAGVKKIFVLIDKDESEDILEKLGLTPINAEHFAARSVELMISRPSVSDLVNIGTGQFDIFEFAAKQTNLIGKEIGAVQGKYYNCLGLSNDSKYKFDKTTVITDTDTLLLLITTGKEKEVEKSINYHKSKK